VWNLSTPGVYYEHTDAGAPRVAALRTDIAGLVGIARRGPVHRAVPIGSWRQFEAWFGAFTGAGYLAYAARGFFECGGRRAWIVRLASPATAIAGTTLASASAVPPPPAWRVEASSPGVWGNDLAIRVVTTHRAQTRSLPQESTPHYTTVGSVTGFVRGTHVRMPIAPVPVFRIVSHVDAVERRLYWVHPDPRRRSSWEQPLTGVDLNTSLVLESVEYTVLVFDRGRLIERHDDVTLVPEHPRYGPVIVPGLPEPPVDARGWSVPLSPPLIRIEELRDAAAIGAAQPLVTPDDRAALTGGADGLSSLTVRDFIGEPSSPLDSDVIVRDRTRGIRALERAAEVAIVAVPDIHIQPLPPPDIRPLPPCEPDPCLPPPPPGPAPVPPLAAGDLPPAFALDDVYRVQAALVDHCETRRDRIAVLDPPYETTRDARLGTAAIRAWRRRFDSSFAALYYPWIAVADPLRGTSQPTRAVPPSGHVAGFFAHTDLNAGVHTAPANGPLMWLQDLLVPIDDTTHGVLNDAHVNAIRAFAGRGLRICGARTLSSDADLRYVNVRRYLLMIEKAIGIACQWAVAEPNDTQTRARLHLSLTSFLLAEWQKGALAGAAPREAFFVRCDQTNNPAEGRNRGQLVAEVGVAAVTPFEFVVVRVGRVDNGLEIEEHGVVQGVPA
jgi:phage tail sheath protein FI